MQTVDVPFGEWLPSNPDYKNPGCTVADNVVPTPGGYGPILGLSEAQVTTSGPCRGAAQFLDGSGGRVIVWGSESSLFTLRGGSVTETSGLTSIGSERWAFTRFNDMIVATAPGNDPQYLQDVDLSTVWQPLPGGPPRARYGARVSDFLMLGSLSGYPSRVQWSALNDPAGTWGADRRTQAGFLECPRALGEVVGITGGRFPLIFQERGVSRIEYVGPPRVWHREEVEEARGCTAPRSIVQIGFLVYYLGGDGFYVTDGSQFQPISSGRVARWIFDTIDPSRLSDTHGAIDWKNECVIWAFKTGMVRDDYDRLLIYSWTENRWSTATVTLSQLLSVRTDAMTLEEIDLMFPSIEDVPGSFDDPRWAGAERRLAAFVDGDGETSLRMFDGPPLAAEWQTGAFQPSPGRRVFASKARPLIEDPMQAAEVAAYSMQGNRNKEYSTYATAGPDGACPIRADGVTMALSCKIPEGAQWHDAQGVQVTFRTSGGR